MSGFSDRGSLLMTAEVLIEEITVVSGRLEGEFNFNRCQSHLFPCCEQGGGM